MHTEAQRVRQEWDSARRVRAENEAGEAAWERRELEEKRRSAAVAAEVERRRCGGQRREGIGAIWLHTAILPPRVDLRGGRGAREASPGATWAACLLFVLPSLVCDGRTPNIV